jgi:type II secretory pathway predicted ATPase ExeA
MYRSFFGITMNPFEKETLAVPFESEDFQNLTKKFDFLLKTRGLGLFTGRAGSGKTYTIRKFTEDQNLKNYKIFYLNTTSVSNLQFYRALAYVMRLELSHRKGDLYEKVRDEITRIYKDTHITPVLIIDEAQLLKQDILIDLTLLLNYVLDSRNYLTIALMGTEDLESSINKVCYESLRQRLVTRYSMKGMTGDEFMKFVSFSLQKVGATSKIFEESVLTAIYSNSKGNMRRACQFLTNCLITAAENGEYLISEKTLSKVYDELVF